MNNYPIRYAFRLDPATEAALEQIARHTFQSKASIMRRYVQEGVRRDVSVGAEWDYTGANTASLLNQQWQRKSSRNDDSYEDYNVRNRPINKWSIWATTSAYHWAKPNFVTAVTVDEANTHYVVLTFKYNITMDTNPHMYSTMIYARDQFIIGICAPHFSHSSFPSALLWWHWPQGNRRKLIPLLPNNSSISHIAVILKGDSLANTKRSFWSRRAGQPFRCCWV